MNEEEGRGSVLASFQAYCDTAEAIIRDITGKFQVSFVPNRFDKLKQRQQQIVLAIEQFGVSDSVFRMNNGDEGRIRDGVEVSESSNVYIEQADENAPESEGEEATDSIEVDANAKEDIDSIEASFSAMGGREDECDELLTLPALQQPLETRSSYTLKLQQYRKPWTVDESEQVNWSQSPLDLHKTTGACQTRYMRLQKHRKDNIIAPASPSY